MIRRPGSPYEVRCPRCDVSFPVETKRCVHCGGPTAAADAPAPIAIDSGATSPWIRTSEGAPGGAGPAGTVGAPSAPGNAGGDGLEVPEEAAPTLGATLLRTFGSLFWVIALIAFSILRSCGED